MVIPIPIPSYPTAKWYDKYRGPYDIEAPPKFKPGEAVNSSPYEARMRMDFTTPIGVWTGASYSLFFQLPKWGYVRFKIDEWITVSPVFREYYELTVKQKDQLEGIIKTSLTSISNAIADMELIWHDLRKFKINLEHFQKIERGKWLINHGKKDDGEKLKTEGEQTLKAIFIDEVDVHTGEMIALKSIAPRWPTIIADFMRLEDKHKDPKKIAEDLKISEAEGVVLATKNKLYQDWRDKIFKETLKRRYKYLTEMLEARKASVDEYRNMLKPTLARYKMMSDALSSPAGRELMNTSWMRYDAQGVSMDYMRLWAWKPMAPLEKYRVSRTMFDKIKAIEAGFTKDEIKTLKKTLGKTWPKNDELEGLPQEPSIDRIVREYWKYVEKNYGVKLTIEDVYKARQMLVNQFRETMGGFGGREPWIFSPYYLFIDVPMYRSVLRLPTGVEIEDVMIEELEVSTRSQNVIIINCLELIAKDKKLEDYINSMIGTVRIVDEKGVKRTIPIEEILKEEFPEVFIEEEEELDEKMKGLEKVKETVEKVDETGKKVKESVKSFLDAIGLGDVMFFRALGPYEFAVVHRMAVTHHKETGPMFALVRDFLKSKFGVAGVNPVW
jgi:hypothetical protein